LSQTPSEAHDSPIRLATDGESGEIRSLPFRNRKLHRLLDGQDPESQEQIVTDAIELGAEMLDRAGHQGDLDQLDQAVTRLDEQAAHIVETAIGGAEQAAQDAIGKLTAQLESDESPFASMLSRFDPGVDGNVVDAFRDLITSSISKAARSAVGEMTEATRQHLESLAKSMAIIDKVAAADQARLDESSRGTAKGIDHELNVESILGQLVGAAGDGLDDVSTVTGLAGSKKGDKVILPRGGVAIVTEEKHTKPISENKARELLDESMKNRGAELAMLIVDDESKVPGNQPYHLIGDDKVVVAADPVTLRLVYCYMRGKAIELAQRRREVDDNRVVEALDEIIAHVGEISRSMEKFKLLRTEHTKATKAIGQAAGYVDDIAATMTDAIEAVGRQIDSIVEEPGEGRAAA
jgi:hypothetical protein